MPHRSHSRPPELPEGFSGYAVLEPSGAIRLVPDLGTAVERAQHAAKKSGGLWTVEADAGQGHEAAGGAAIYENPPAPELQPEHARRACGLPTLSTQEILSLPLEEAHREVAAYFNTTRWAVAGRGEARPGRIRKSKSGSAQAYQKLDTMLNALLRVNFKLEKKVKRPGLKRLDPKALGLMLVPEKSVFRGKAGNGTRLPLAYTATQEKPPLTPYGLASTLCWGATEECSSTCLAYSGMNVQLHNTIVKLQTTQALMGSPRAFYRVLLAALDRWFLPKGRPYGGTLRFVRLNVLSDLPWELLIPDLFARYPGKTVALPGGGRRRMVGYDYTAVPGRRPPDGYDLTFSYKGTGANRFWCASEVARGRRVAVVFLLPGSAKQRSAGVKEGKPAKGARLPQVWDGPGGRLRVVDGDMDDFRPLDGTDPVYVGLRFKTVRGGQAAEARARKGVFVVQVAKVEVIGGQLVAVETPRQTGVDVNA